MDGETSAGFGIHGSSGIIAWEKEEDESENRSLTTVRKGRGPGSG